MSATRLEWLPGVKADLFVIQTPSHLSREHVEALQRLIKSGRPTMLVGSFAEGMDEPLLGLAGVHVGGPATRGPVQLCHETNQAAELVLRSPREFDAYCRPEAGVEAENSNVIYGAADRADLAVSRGSSRLAAWNPPELRSIEGKPLHEVWGSTGAPYALAAGVLNQLLKAESDLHVSRIDLGQTLSIAAWQTRDGSFRILAGNLEEGLRDDADLSRHTRLAIPASWLKNGSAWKDAWTGRGLDAASGVLPLRLPQAGSVLLEHAP